jgi:hypothetical protein
VARLEPGFDEQFAEGLGRLKFYRVKERGRHRSRGLRGLSSDGESVFLFDGAAEDALSQKRTRGYRPAACGLSIYENLSTRIATGDEKCVEAIRALCAKWNRVLSQMDVAMQALVKEEARIYRHEGVHCMRRLGETEEVISPREGVKYDLGLGYEKEMLGGVSGLRDSNRVYGLDIQTVPVFFWD